MQLFDWIILIVTLLFIVIYGAWKTKGSKNVEDFILGGNETPWHIVGLSVMATQASAITFLSTPYLPFSLYLPPPFPYFFFFFKQKTAYEMDG